MKQLVSLAVAFLSINVLAQAPNDTPAVRDCTKKLTDSAAIRKILEKNSSSSGPSVSLGMAWVAFAPKRRTLTEIIVEAEEAIARQISNNERDRAMDTKIFNANDLKRPPTFGERLVKKAAEEADKEAGRIQIGRQQQLEALKTLEKSRKRAGLSLFVDDIIADVIDPAKTLKSLDLSGASPALAKQIREGMAVIVRESGDVGLKDAYKAAQAGLADKYAAATKVGASATAFAERDAVEAFVQFVGSQTVGKSPIRTLLGFGGRALAWGTGVYAAIDTARIIESATTARLHAADSDALLDLYAKDPSQIFFALEKKQFTPEYFCRRVTNNYALGHAINAEIAKMYAESGVQPPQIYVGATIGAAPPKSVPASTGQGTH